MKKTCANCQYLRKNMDEKPCNRCNMTGSQWKNADASTDNGLYTCPYDKAVACTMVGKSTKQKGGKMTKHCDNCKHWDKEMGAYPCKNCTPDGSHWEKIEQDSYNTLQHIPMSGFTGGYLHRISVPGGWLVIFSNDKLTLDEQGNTKPGLEYRSGITFYPDPNHEWNAEEVKLVPTVVKE